MIGGPRGRAWRAEIELPLRRDDIPPVGTKSLLRGEGRPPRLNPSPPSVLSMLMLVASVGTTASGCYFCRLPTVTSRHPLASSRDSRLDTLDSRRGRVPTLVHPGH